MGIIPEIWYSRLPTGFILYVANSLLLIGHTHEDIDSVFGQIWLKMRLEPVHTIEMYAKLVTEHFKSPTRPLMVKTVYVIPDY